MSTSIRAFKTGLYTEHLEEAAFLYQQRRALLRNPAIGWSRLRDFEARLESHLDALMVGGSLALQVCRDRLSTDDAGELFCIVFVICRQGQASLLNDSWRGLDFVDGRKVLTGTDAQKFALPVLWTA